MDIPQRGRIAVVGDPQGAVLTLLLARAGDAPDRRPDDGDWLWNEIWSSDVDAFLAFYRQLVPEYAPGAATPGGFRYLAPRASRGQRRGGHIELRRLWPAVMAAACPLCLSLAGCRSGIYGSVGIAGPSVDLGPVKVNTGVHLGRWL